MRAGPLGSSLGLACPYGIEREGLAQGMDGHFKLVVDETRPTEAKVYFYAFSLRKTVGLGLAPARVVA